MSLPSTYYDLACQLRPYVVDFAEQDALDLVEEAEPPSATGGKPSWRNRCSTKALNIVWHQ